MLGQWYQSAPMIFGKKPIPEGMGSREGEKGLTTFGGLYSGITGGSLKD
jgi:hypothetical protein